MSCFRSRPLFVSAWLLLACSDNPRGSDVPQATGRAGASGEAVMASSGSGIAGRDASAQAAKPEPEGSSSRDAAPRNDARDASPPDPRGDASRLDDAGPADAAAGPADAAAGPDAPGWPLDPAAPLDPFDPNAVYIIGTLTEYCSSGAIAPVNPPDRAVGGLHCHSLTDYTHIRPTDGRLLYNIVSATDAAFRVFRGDGPVAIGGPLPDDPQANDELVPAPRCADIDGGRVSGLLVAPDGATLHRCNGSWFDASGAVMALDTPPILQLGPAGTALRDEYITEFATGENAWITAFEPTFAVATRARADGYWYVHAPGEAHEHVQLWHVALDASATLLGTYPAPPAHQQLLLSGAKLDAGGRLLQIAQDMREPFRNTVVRRSLEGESQVLFDTKFPQAGVNFHGFKLVTGP
jgi:hypothetical protein